MIEVNRNNIIIRNVKEASKEYHELNYKYSLYDRVYHKYTFSVFTKIGEDIYLPSSIQIENIQKIFPKKQISKSNIVPIAKSIQYTLKNQPRNELQEKAISFIMSMKKDSEWPQRFLALETGTGKTYITINCISKFKKKAFIIVDSLDLAAQWKTEFLNHTDLSDKDIEILSGKESVDLSNVNKSASIYIAIHRTLTNMLNDDPNSINMLMSKLGIGLRVFDEAHVNFENICKINSLSNVAYTLYLTATPSRSSFIDNSLYARVFGEVPYFNGKELSGEKYHTVVLYHMNSNPDFDTKLSVKTKYGFSASKWAQYIENDGFEVFLENLEKIFEKFDLIKRQKKTAIMLPTIELIKKTKAAMEENHSDVEFGTFIGEVPENKRLAEREKTFFFTNDKIFNKAIDVKDLEILINFVPMSSLVKTEQTMGRLRNRKEYQSILIDIVDDGFDECIRQFKIRKRFYKKKAKKIVELS